MSMAPRGRAWLLAWCAACALLTACSTPTPTPPSPPLQSTPGTPPTPTVPVPAPTAWSGRLSLSIQKDFSQQTHIHIAFELEGNADEGQLQVEGPFGTAAIVLRWRPGQAILSQGERSYRFASLPDLVSWSEQALAPNGVWMAMKGRDPLDERTALPPHIDVFHVEPLLVPGLAAERCLVWMRTRPTL